MHAKVAGFIHVKRFLNVSLRLLVFQLNFFQAEIQGIEFQELDAIGVIHVESFGEIARNITIVGTSHTIVDFIENKEVSGLENVELLFDDFQLVGSQRFGLGILSFSKHLVKLFRLGERDANGIEVNPALNIPANCSQVGAELRRGRALWLRTVEIGLIAQKRSSKEMFEFFSEGGRRRVVLFQIDELIESEQLGLRKANEIALGCKTTMECETQQRESSHDIASALQGHRLRRHFAFTSSGQNLP